VDQPLRQATHSFVLVCLAALAFFAFVIGSGLTGALGQSVFGFLFGVALLAYVWRRLDPETRQRVVVQTRRVLHRSPAQP
jgi:membrane associated rhomboid family serine protease